MLVHTTGGELLRCLEGGDGPPGHLALSREGLVVAIYGRGHVAAFTMNGCRLRYQQHTDNIQVQCNKIRISMDYPFRTIEEVGAILG